MPRNRVVLVATLTVRADALDAFRAFEAEAARVMAKHGGAIERAVFVPARDGEPYAKEVHVVVFPDARALDAYRADDALRAAAHLRDASVVATEILVGVDGPRYGAERAGRARR